MKDNLIVVLLLSKVIFTENKYGSSNFRVAQLLTESFHSPIIEAVPDLLVSIEQTTHFVNCNVNCHSLKYWGSQVTNKRLGVSGHYKYFCHTIKNY